MSKDKIFNEGPRRPKTVQVPVEMPESGFPVIFYFNRFGIEDLGGPILVHFGFVSIAGEVLGAYSALLTRTFLVANRSTWLEYLGKIGSSPEKPLDLSWRPPVSRIAGVEFVNAMRIGRSGTDAEFRLYCTSMIAVIDRQGDKSGEKPLLAQPLALLQTSLEQQQLLLLALVKHSEQ
jgi:hypothetical protein